MDNELIKRVETSTKLRLRRTTFTSIVEGDALIITDTTNGEEFHTPLTTIANSTLPSINKAIIEAIEVSILGLTAKRDIVEDIDELLKLCPDDLVVTIDDSRNAGNCDVGSMNSVRITGATYDMLKVEIPAKLLLEHDKSPSAIAAVNQALIRHNKK